MSTYQYTEQNVEKKDRSISAIITTIVAILVFLFIFYYKFTKFIEKPTVVTTMLINFGDEREAQGALEPIEQEGSLSASTNNEEVTDSKTTPVEAKQPSEAVKKTESKEKIITGTNKVVAAPKEVEKKVVKKEASPTKAIVKPKSTTNATTGTGDGQGKNAINNIIRGRGTSSTSQGDGTEKSGNSGDPLGGNSNGDSRIGVDRKLVNFIPGTEGRGGSQPAHNCESSGTISIAYTVDKAGNVTSARRVSGISDPCAVEVTVGWVKKYVKAEKASTSSTGTYRIRF